MKFTKALFFCVSIAALFSCNQDDGKIDFTFLQLNDVYEIAPIQGGEYGGMARVATVHEQLLKENSNTFMFVAGDFLNPSLLGTIQYQGERIRGKQMIETMNAMGVDLVAFGNHEFDLSATDLQKRLDESNFNWISGNVLQNKDGVLSPFSNKHNKVGDTFIKEFSDADGTTIKIGFISVCVPSNPRDYVAYKDVFKEAERSYADLKDKVDVVFGLTHVTIAQDLEIAKRLPNIPLIMGGHEHTNMLIPQGDSFVAKADANAKTVYVHKISYDKKTKKTSIQSVLKEINSDIVENEQTAVVVNKWQGILKKKIKEIIDKPEEIILNAQTPLDGRDKPIRSIQTNLGVLITKSMSYAFDDAVDCALVNGGSIRIDDELEGAITPVDIFRVLPYGGAVLKVKLKGSLLLKVLDFREKAKGTGAYLQRYNVQKKNKGWYVQSKPINPNKIYTVAFSDYLLKGYDIPFLTEENKEVVSVYKPTGTEKSFDIRNSIILYLKSLK
ncbi:bifunctional metallophosphatase/5'-nucleotidase [Polaribacter pacificus]|nr:bifunctional metallophosphatase/5'-nucleotidase [Polaribacter pacificus]